MKRYLLILAVLCTMCAIVSAQQPARVPAYRGVIAREQPGGDTIHTYLRGDEHWHFMMTVDGWEVKENTKGKICYCKLKTRKVNGEKQQVSVVTCRTAHDQDKRSKCEQRWLDKHGIMKK